MWWTRPIDQKPDQFFLCEHREEKKPLLSLLLYPFLITHPTLVLSLSLAFEKKNKHPFLSRPTNTAAHAVKSVKISTHCVLVGKFGGVGEI